MQACLGAAVRGEILALTVESGGASGDDDGSTTHGPAVREHRPDRVLHGEERAGEVHRHGAVPDGEVEVRDPRVLTEQLNAGVRDDDADLPTLSRDARVRGGDALLIGDVELDREGSGVGAGRPLCGLQVAVAEYDACAFFGEPGGHPLPDPGSGTCDQCCLAGQPARH